jgi:cytidine deaminase
MRDLIFGAHPAGTPVTFDVRLRRMTLSNVEEHLIARAREIIRLRGKSEWHAVGCAMRTRSGRVFAAVHLEAHVGRIAVCAEAIALGMGAAEGDTEIEQIVAVDQAGHVVSPCGMCRELILDYSPTAKVIVPGADGPVVVLAETLLPAKYHRGEA